AQARQNKALPVDERVTEGNERIGWGGSWPLRCGGGERLHPREQRERGSPRTSKASERFFLVQVLARSGARSAPQAREDTGRGKKWGATTNNRRRVASGELGRTPRRRGARAVASWGSQR